MGLPFFHRAIDRLAMWTEDRVARDPQGYRPAPEGPLDCFGPLGPLPSPPAGSGRWQVPSPHPSAATGDRLSVHCFAAAGEPGGTLLLVPPWKIGSPRLVSGYTRLFTRLGFRVWLVAPPHHLDRTVAGQRPGEGFVTLDLGRMRAVLEQQILEIRLCAALAQGGGQVGLLGLSLGGLAAALAATGPEPIDFAALVAPAVDLPSILAETPIGRRYQALAHRAGSPLPPENALGSILAALGPAHRSPTARRLFIATGIHDGIVPPAGPVALAKAWDVEPAFYPRGHLSLLFLSRQLRQDLRRFAGEQV